MNSRIGIELEDAGALDELEPLWIGLHHHHQASAPGLAPFVDDAASWAARRSSYAEWLGEPGSFLLVARLDGAAVGYAMVRVAETAREWTDTWVVGERLAELETLVVAPEHRGRGLGSALLDRVEAELAGRGIDDVLIGVVPGNQGAMRLYERRGYAPTWTILSRFGARR